jgi:SAM-dependent methyltransferase
LISNSIDMDIKQHWSEVYSTKDHKKVSWYADHVSDSLNYIESLQLPKTASIIDVGAGASTLIDDLLAREFSKVSVLDISEHALSISRQRLGGLEESVTWIVADVVAHDFPKNEYDLWHDRAVFHFLIDDEHRGKYAVSLRSFVKKGGYFLISVFADDGPEMCSGIKIRRHSELDLEQFFGDSFDVIKSARMVHRTPSGTEQRFVTVLMKRK